MKSWNDPIDTFPPQRAGKPVDKKKPLRLLVATLVVLVIVIPLVHDGLNALSRRLGSWDNYGDIEAKPFQWSSIHAKESLEFESCYDDFECAKLKLPLDYFNGTHPDSTVGVALLKLPARVSVDDPRYGGPILINPGGPGGSGVGLALGAAKNFQVIVDSPDDPNSLKDWSDKLTTAARYFDIIGFDPRGIGLTEPAATCMPDLSSWWSWRLREATEGILGSSDAALGRLWSMNHGYGTSCKQSMDTEKGPDIKQYMTTAYVARDMLEIVERHAEYVAHKASQLFETSKTRRSECTRPQVATYEKDTVKLQYWGFSYGTYLGSTFASMYPDRVGRLILDGVVNSDDYNASLGNGSLHDNEKAMTSFYTFCLEAGPQACPLADSAASVKDMEYRVQSIVKSLYHNPLPINSPISGPEVLTYSDLKGLLFGSLYTPALVFPTIAKVLVAVENGGGQILEMLAMALRFSHVYSCSINNAFYDTDVPQYAILCGDGFDQTNETVAEFEKYWHMLEDISPTSGSIWAILRLKCASWKIRAVHRFKGIFGGKTSHPILWISNTADPVTPLKSARIMSERFPGSVVLAQDSAGHCSISTPTPCTLKYIRDYFQHGELPAPNTLCVPPSTPFSLNSTDPSSPFYEPSLGDSAVSTYDDATSQLSCGTMHAAKHVQKWVAKENKYGPVHNMDKLSGLLTALQEPEWMLEYTPMGMNA